MNDEEELEEELRKLDVKEDLGEDSDITPTNSPRPTNPVKFELPPKNSSNISNYFERDFSRFSYNDDSALRTSSSLSWGEDEFEGEATRTVTALFEQLDQMMYCDAFSKTVKFPYVEFKNIKEKKSETGQKKQKKPKITPSISDFLASGESSEDDSLNLVDSNYTNIGPPSKALVNECKEWIDNFPHLRIIGVGIDLLHYEKIECKLLSLKGISERDAEIGKEESYAINGEYEDKLIFQTINPVMSKEKKIKSKPSNEIYGGSLDGALLKDYILNKAFEHAWPSLCQIIEPLASKYGNHVLNQSTKISSISKTISGSCSELPSIDSRELRKNDFAKPPQSLPLVDSGSGSKASLINSRPSSAAYVLPNKVPKIKNEIEELSELKISGESCHVRSMSASQARELSSKPSTSLPSILSFEKNSRPLSSKSRNHLLTPMSTVENRPQSTSSYARLKHTDKYSKIRTHTKTIEESEYNFDEMESPASSPSPTYSRHTFLPRINSKNTKSKISNSSTALLSPYSKSLAAISRPLKSNHESPRLESYSEEAEPFVSWIVSKVDEQSAKDGKRSSKGNVKEASPSLPSNEAKYFRRLSNS